MALGKSYVKGLVDKAPPPDKLEAMGDMGEPDADEEGGPSDEDGDEAAKASAFADFVSALGLSPSKAAKARAALDEYMSLCK
ncbi:MAG TPA: hypothetical protein VN449_11085 [Gaiellaceae bacterium]|nr:hypothetical protein [Gaiellaceae bacterium]